MSQAILNSNDNISIANGVSIWFQPNFTGEYEELGDLVVDGVTLSPEFLDHRSYRFGINALRKRLLTQKNASMTITINEPNILSLQRAVFGSTPTSGESATAFQGARYTVRADGGGTYIDLQIDGGESIFSNITVTEIFASTDALYAADLLGTNAVPDTEGKVYFDATDAGLDEGDLVYVKYQKALTGLYKTEIFGSSTASIEGAAKFQVLNEQGGVLQLWDIASISLAPNGDLPYPLDAVQTIPMTATLQERSGTFGNIYTA